MKITEKLRNLLKNYIFVILRTIFSHFPTEVCSCFKNVYWVLNVVVVERFYHSDSKMIQKVLISCVKNLKILLSRFSTHLESFRSVFENRCNVLFKRVLYSSFFIFERFGTSNPLNFLEIVQQYKTTKIEKFWIFRHFLGQFDAFFYFKLFLSLGKSLLKQRILPLFNILNIQIRKV